MNISLGTILLIVLIIALFSGGHFGFYPANYGYGGGGLLLVVLVLLLLFGRI